MTGTIARRRFLQAFSAAAGFNILPSGLLANSPNGRLCTAHIGIGGKGRTDLAQIAGHPKTEVVALCDVDRKARLTRTATRADYEEEPSHRPPLSSPLSSTDQAKGRHK